MRRYFKYVFILTLLMTLKLNAFGQFYINLSTVPYSRVVNNSCAVSNTEISPAKDNANVILLYLSMTYSDNSALIDFINGTGVYIGAEGLPSVDYNDNWLTVFSDCEWGFVREYFLVRSIDGYTYVMSLNEKIIVVHDNHIPFYTYNMPDEVIYGEGEDALPQGLISDLIDLDIALPCDNMSLVTMTYQDELIDETPPYLTYQRTYKLSSKCNEEHFANIKKIFKIGIIINSTPVLNTLYYKETDYPMPYTSIQELRDNGCNIKYPLKYETELIIESNDEEHPVINGATRRKYKITNPYADEQGVYRSVNIYQTLVKIPDQDVSIYVRKEDGDLYSSTGSTSNKGKLYVGTSPWDQGLKSVQFVNWYYVHLTKIKDGEIEWENDYYFDYDHYEIKNEGTANMYYEFLVDDQLDGGKYNVKVLTKNMTQNGLPANHVVFESNEKIGQMKMALYANPVGVMMHYSNLVYQAGVYVATAVTHLVNLDDNDKPVYSGYCAELTYDNLFAKNRPDFYSICNHPYLPFTYKWEITGGSRCTDVPLYFKYSNFGMNYELYYNTYGFSIWGENPELLLTRSARTVKLTAESESGYVMQSEPRDIRWVTLTCSNDPNAIVGPAGYGDDKMIAAADKIDYRIYFENDTTATSAASRVTVRCPLHHQADSTTVRLGHFGFGDYSFDVPQMSAFYSKRITETAGSLGVWVDVTAGLDIDNNEMYWIFQSIDPATGVAPIDTIGFLPVNDTLTGKGEGYVTFSVSALNTTVTGDTIAEQASIVFDENDAMLTNVYVNKFDAVSPSSVLVGDTTTVHDDYNLKFRSLATDDIGGSGIQYIDLYVRVDNTQYVFASRMEADTLHYADSLVTTYQIGQGAIYDFVCQATDNVGNKEPFRTTPDFTFLNLFPPTDMFLTNRYFNEGDTVATEIGKFYAVDDQSTDDFKYALIAGEGDTDNDKFMIDSCFLRTNYDFRCKDMFDFGIRVQCTDNSGATFEKAFQLHAKSTETPSVTKVDTTLCYGESIYFAGEFVSEPGYYYDTLLTVRGCDSVVKLSLNNYPELIHFDLDTLHCIYEDFSIPGFRLPWDSISQRLTKWTETSDTLLVYQYDTINNNGCADVMNLKMHVYPQERDYHHVYACLNGMPFRYGDSLFTEAGFKDVHFKSKITGCDSVVTVELEVNPVYLNIPMDTTICSNDVFELFGQQFTEPGFYKVYGETAIHHCDSMYAVTLHTKPISEKYLDLTVCPTDLPMMYENFEITADMESGLYYDTLVAKNACDSIVTLDLTVREAATQHNGIYDGWNWYSTYLDLTEIDGLQALKDGLGDNGEQIKSHDQFVVNSGGTWAGSLTGVENEKMYMIKANADLDLDAYSCTTEGTDHPITIAPGWNWIGYVSRYAMPLETAMEGMSVEPQEGDIIKSYDHGFSMYYSDFGGWFGSLNQMQPGAGYMYKSNATGDITLTYPTVAGDRGEQPAMLPTHWNVTSRQFPETMTFIGKITIDNLPATTEMFEVGVFCDNEVRGSGRAILMEGLGTYRLFIQVYGNQGETFTFRLYDHHHNQEAEATSTQMAHFAANANYGSIKEPYAFKFYNTTNGIDDIDGMSHELTLVPNPANSTDRVLLYCDFTPDERAGLTVEVHNTLGVSIQQVEPTRFPVQLKEIEHPGTYTVKVTTGTGRILVKKLVVRK